MKGIGLSFPGVSVHTAYAPVVLLSWWLLQLLCDRTWFGFGVAHCDRVALHRVDDGE